MGRRKATMSRGLVSKEIAMYFPRHSALVPYRRPQFASGSTKSRASAAIGRNLNTVIQTAEVGAAAFACGIVQGVWPGRSLWGVPYDLLAGLGLHVLAFAGVGKGYQKHMHALGDGALAAFLVTVGRDAGGELKRKYKIEGVSGIDGVSGGASLADEELARMVRAGR